MIFESATISLPAFGSKTSAFRPTSWTGQLESPAAASGSSSSKSGPTTRMTAWWKTKRPPTVCRPSPTRDSVTSLNSIAET